MKCLKPLIAIALMAAGATFWSATAGISPASAQTGQPVLLTSNPVTYMTVIDDDHIVVQITEGEFFFHGWLERTSGNKFSGQDEQVRVMYDMDTKQLVVINVRTGDEFYNYIFSNVNEGTL